MYIYNKISVSVAPRLSQLDQPYKNSLHCWAGVGVPQQLDIHGWLRLEVERPLVLCSKSLLHYSLDFVWTVWAFNIVFVLVYFSHCVVITFYKLHYVKLLSFLCLFSCIPSWLTATHVLHLGPHFSPHHYNDVGFYRALGCVFLSFCDTNWAFTSIDWWVDEVILFYRQYLNVKVVICLCHLQ